MHSKKLEIGYNLTDMGEPHFHYREILNLTSSPDTIYHPLKCGVPSTARAVMLRLQVRSSVGVDRILRVADKDMTSNVGKSFGSINNAVAAIPGIAQCICPLDPNGNIWYQTSNSADTDQVIITVTMWFGVD